MEYEFEKIKSKFSMNEVVDYVRKNACSEENKKLFLNGRNFGNRTITRVVFENIYVLNKILTMTMDLSKFKEAISINHENVERILCWFQDEHFHYALTNLFKYKLKTVWEEMSQFIKFDVKKMFLDFFEGILFLKNKNIIHTTIHSDNMAFNGTNWYISGILTTQKLGECTSGTYNVSSLKSRRFSNENHFLPSDDLWQLILLYVVTYYGYNPFRTYTKIQNYEKWSFDFSLDCQNNINRGICQSITVTDKIGSYGDKLHKMLTNLFENSYEEFKIIIENNNEENVIDLIDGDAVCIICYANKKQVTFSPCAHNIMCFPCAERLASKTSLICPYCRQKVLEWFVKTF
jgi:hypothetical protein